MEGHGGEQRPLWFIFALPIGSVALVCGVLLGGFLRVSIFNSAIAVVVGLILFKFAPSKFQPFTFFIFIAAFGFLRIAIGDLIVLSHHTIFTAARDWCDALLGQSLHEPNRTLISGILFGGGSAFTPEWKQVFRATGTMHVVAVSGTNVVFVVHWVEAILRKIKIGARKKLFALYFFIAAYMLMAGASASVVRAGIMAFVAHAAPHFGRRSHPLHALAAAVSLMVFINPTIATDIGFQFSCLATFGLFIFSYSDSGSFAATIGETIAATICVMPLEIFYFKIFSFSAFIANIAIAPFVPILMLYGVGQIFASILFPKNAMIIFLLGRFGDWSAHLALSILAAISHIPGSSGELQISAPAVGIWYLIIAIYAVFRCRKLCRRIYTS
ncbi:MAG: ComEC/Rec2 family competence protein [Candidatus Magasanikbacteria bacterium]|nr:ComEC/Rec2 family competence protein [Candidatus Magasanikbacteria bacterium]